MPGFVVVISNFQLKFIPFDKKKLGQIQNKHDSHIYICIFYAVQLFQH